MKERTSGVRGRGIWRRRAESERAPAQECKRENEAEEKKNKEQSKRERKSIPCLEERPTPKVQLC